MLHQGVPSWWWNPDKYVGPAGLLQAYRFIQDSGDTAMDERLADLDDHFSVFRCRGIANCNAFCPKGLLPLRAISGIKRKMLEPVRDCVDRCPLAVKRYAIVDVRWQPLSRVVGVYGSAL